MVYVLRQHFKGLVISSPYNVFVSYDTMTDSDPTPPMQNSLKVKIMDLELCVRSFKTLVFTCPWMALLYIDTGERDPVVTPTPPTSTPPPPTHALKIRVTDLEFCKILNLPNPAVDFVFGAVMRSLPCDV